MLDNFRFLAGYNQWFNKRLFDACEKLSDGERKRDRGAFFGSIHNTLNHLVWADQLWLARFAAQPGASAQALGAGLLGLPPGAVPGEEHQPAGTNRRRNRGQAGTRVGNLVTERAEPIFYL